MMKLVVLSCLMAAASASVIAPFAPLAYSAYTAPLAYAAPFLPASNYRGPLSLAPGQPANILAADGRPLDTLDVNLDRAAHYTAKAFDGVHLLKKRSVALAAPLVAAPVSRIALAHSPLYAPGHIAYSAPIAAHYGAHYAYGAPLIHY
ncbi:hypothetical protein ABMA28_004642 [Loxostege sticticalis]|uniref:Cuticle protein n=1 Tax=Loxostege sticticalis TaxID=481309 RepID=A0ABD0SRX5_LOXSC